MHDLLSVDNTDRKDVRNGCTLMTNRPMSSGIGEHGHTHLFLVDSNLRLA